MGDGRGSNRIHDYLLSFQIRTSTQTQNPLTRGQVSLKKDAFTLWQV